MGGSSVSESASWRSTAAAPPALAWRQTSPSRSNKSFDVGQFAVLPRVPTWDANSVVYNQLQHVNGDVAGHPLCIIGTKDNGRTVTCLQVTSFGDRSIEEKYPGNSETRRLKKSEYVAIDHNNSLPRSGLPVLRLANNEKMRYQSYVHLDQFFTIETSHPSPWATGSLQLDRTSIRSLECAFADFVSGVAPRQPSGAVRSPLDYRPRETLTMLWMGVNDHRFVKPTGRGAVVAIVAPPSPPPLQKRWETSRNWRSRV